MKVTWLAHAGFLFENENIRILVDPRLAGGAGERGTLRPDVVLITHEHEGHCDAATLSRIAAEAEAPITFLAPHNAYRRLKELGGGHNYVMLNAHSVWSERGVTFYAVHAEHSDRTAVGFIIDDGDKTFYVSGDTLYNYDVLDDVIELVEDGVDYAFLPICGRDNCMNAKDAADFAYELGAKAAIPTHYDAHDAAAAAAFDFEDAIVLAPWEPTEL